MMMRRKITATRRTPAVVPVAAEVAPAPVEALTRGRVMGQPNGCGVFIATHGEKWNLPPEQMRGILHGDRVAVRLVRTDYRGRKEGAVVEVLESREVVGRLYRERNTAFIAPHETRYGRDIAVAGDGEHDALPDDIVVAKIVRHPFEHRYALGEVVEVLGNRRDVEGAALKNQNRGAPAFDSESMERCGDRRVDGDGANNCSAHRRAKTTGAPICANCRLLRLTAKTRAILMMRCCAAATPTAGGCGWRLPMSGIMCAPIRRWIKRRCCAATRRIFPVRWCRCCPRHCPTASVHCAPNRIVIAWCAKSNAPRRARLNRINFIRR